MVDIQIIHNKTYELRGERVMLDFDIAKVYGMETKVFKQAVKRNIERFPADFMFQLTQNEWIELVANCDQLPASIKPEQRLKAACRVKTLTNQK